MRAIYLTGDTVYLRAFQMEDKEHAAAWMDTPFPINAPRAEEILKERHKEFVPNTHYYAICRSENDEIVGSTKISMRSRTADADFFMAPWLTDADELRAAAMRLIVPWLSVEWDMMTVTVGIAADHERTLQEAGALDMVHTGTFREFYARPAGQRADQLIYQALNPRAEIPDA